MDVHPIELSLGAAVDASTAYVPRGAGRVGVAVHWRRFAVWSEAVSQPSFQQDDWRPVTSGFADSEPKEPRRMERYVDVRGAAAGGFEFLPARATVDRWDGTVSLGLRLGFGVVHTVDDLGSAPDPLRRRPLRPVRPLTTTSPRGGGARPWTGVRTPRSRSIPRGCDGGRVTSRTSRRGSPLVSTRPGLGRALTRVDGRHNSEESADSSEF